MVESNSRFFVLFQHQNIFIDSFRGGTILKVLTRMIEMSADSTGCPKENFKRLI